VEPTCARCAAVAWRRVHVALPLQDAEKGRVRTADTNVRRERSLGGLKGKG